MTAILLVAKLVPPQIFFSSLFPFFLSTAQFPPPSPPPIIKHQQTISNLLFTSSPPSPPHSSVRLSYFPLLSYQKQLLERIVCLSPHSMEKLQ